MTNSNRYKFLLLALAFSGCTGTDVGNPVIDMDVTLYDSESASARKRGFAAAPAGLQVDTAWVSIDRLRFRHASDCNGGAQDEFLGPFAVDMLAPGTPAELSGLELSSTSFCRIEMRWHSLDPDELGSAPPQLGDASMYVSGTRLDGTRFHLRSDRGDELRLDAIDGAFDVDELTHALFVAFDVQTLFDGVDIDSAEVDDDGNIYIEDGVNDALLGVFDDNLEATAKLFDDQDEDGELDPDERDDTDVLAD